MTPRWTAVLVLLAAAGAVRGAVLDDFIRHYEPVEYDVAALRQQHSRVRRHAEPGRDVRLRLRTSDREFRIRLRPDRAVFSPDVVFETNSGPLSFDINSVYKGFLEDDEDAVVQGIIGSDGLFDGSVLTASEHFYIEPAHRYFPAPQDFHSLIYRLSDVTHPRQSHGGCASQLLAARNASAADVTVTSAAGGLVNEWLGHEQLFENLTVRRAAVGSDAADGGADVTVSVSRRRRAVIGSDKTTCTMYLQADHLFYEQFGSEEACIEAMTRHVQQANEIYKSVDFDLDGKQDSIGFMIKRIRLHKPSAVNDVGYRFPGNYGVEKYLELFSEENYDSFCLAYMFTYRDFAGGTLGLAWTGDLNQAGGVCEKNGYYRGSKKSLNSGIISILNYGKRVPPAVSHVTFAHEVGHNFGSQHDPDKNKECTPGGIDGNYIMFARATSGDKRNNNRFSPCSLRSISPVLRVKARSAHGCFVEPQAAICGNGVVEVGEQCDCGWEEDCRESCCIPMMTTPPSGVVPCQLQPTAQCSPSQGPCCNASCELDYGHKCRDDNGCRAISRCNGRTPQCPPSIRQPNRTICNERNVCFKGECSGSICLAYGLESCQCEPGPDANRSKSCELCCKRPGIDQPCISSFEWNQPPYEIPDQNSRPGTPCDQYRGYCDVFDQCRQVDPFGPLATLKGLLLSDKSLSVVKEFMDRYWYMIVLGLVIVILSLIAVIRIFGKSPPTHSRRRHRHSRGTKRVRNDDPEAAPLPDVTAEAAVAAAVAPAALTAPSKGATNGVTLAEGRERGRPPLQRRVHDVRRAAAKARRAASHMALSSRASVASVASGVARVMETSRRSGKRDHSHTTGPDGRKRRRKDGDSRDKSRAHRRQREKNASKENVKVISYSNIQAEGGVGETTKQEPKLSGATANSTEAANGDVDKRKSLPAELAGRKLPPTDVDKRRSLPKPPGSPQKPTRQESPSKQRRSAVELPARPRSPDRARRRRDGGKSRSRPRPEAGMARSSSQRHRSSQREDKKKRSRSISPTKRQNVKPTGKAGDDKDKQKKRFSLHVSPDNVISEWLGRNAKKEPRKHTERTRKKPIVPIAPMHPNDQVLQWLQKSSHEPSGDDATDGMVSPQPTRRVSQSSSQTSGSLRRTPPGRPDHSRVTSRQSSLTSSRQQSASPLRDTASSLSASERRPDSGSPYRGTEQTELSGGSTTRPVFGRSRSQGAPPPPPPPPPPSDGRLSFQAVFDEPVYDLPRGASPESIYDLLKDTRPERQMSAPYAVGVVLPAGRPASAERQTSAPAIQARVHRPAAADRQMSQRPASPVRNTASTDRQMSQRPASPVRHPVFTDRQMSQRPASPVRNTASTDRQMSQRSASPARPSASMERQASAPATHGRKTRQASPSRHPALSDRQVSTPAGRPRRAVSSSRRSTVSERPASPAPAAESQPHQ